MQERKSTNMLFNDLYRNAHIALQSISNVMPACEDEDFKKELQKEYELYEKFICEVGLYMDDNNLEKQDINVFKKTFMQLSIKMNTMTDTSTNHLADMMIKGTLMGITDLRTMLNDKDNPPTMDLEAFCKDLLKIEEESEKRLKEFL